MNPIAECCADAVAFSYRSMDRLVLNAYIPTLQTPAAMAVFFRQVQRKPILAGKVFKDLTERFVADGMHDHFAGYGPSVGAGEDTSFNAKPRGREKKFVHLQIPVFRSSLRGRHRRNGL